MGEQRRKERRASKGVMEKSKGANFYVCRPQRICFFWSAEDSRRYNMRAPSVVCFCIALGDSDPPRRQVRPRV
jgi:hypothetical protein